MPSTKQYELISAGIIEALEESIRTGTNVVPWQKPWTSPARLNSDRNGVSGKPYKGLNPFNLWLRSTTKGFTSTIWLTFKQVKQLGGYVKKGEKSTTVYFWKWIEETTIIDGKPYLGDSYPVIKFFGVFNLEQTENVKLPKRELEVPTEELENWNPIVEAQSVLDAYVNQKGGPRLAHNGKNRAFYMPSTDSISLPEKSQFPKADEYYSTAFHEAGHSTGHTSRLNRMKDGALVTRFGSHNYGKEELVAEFTSAFLSADVGIDSTRDNSTAYLQNWLSKLKNDPKLLLTAASQAQKAATLILSKSVKPVEGAQEVTK